MNPPEVRRPLWKRVEIISLPLVGLVLIATLVSATGNWKSYIAYREKTTVSRDIVETARLLGNSLVDAETAQRGYLLTGNAQYRRPYDNAVKIIPIQTAHLRDIAGNDTAEGPQVTKLVQLIDVKMREMGESIDLRDSHGFQRALELVETNSGEKTMEQIRAVLAKLISIESARLTELVKLVRGRGGRAWLISAGGDLLLGVMLIFASIAIFRASARREELIAALRQDEVRLRELTTQSEAAEERARNILESIGDGFISFDKKWNITYLNAEAERILGRSKSELLGRNYWQEFPANVGGNVERNYRQAAAGGVPVSFETHLEDRNAWWEENIYPGKDGVLSVYFRDITERKRFDERLRHSQKLESLGILAGGIAHDFNNLLTAILGSASLASEVLPKGSPAIPYLDNVLAASERASQLTRQMLAYSGRGRFVVDKIDLSVQVREITALLHASLGGNVELVLNLKEGAFIEADAGQFQSVVMNLVINGAEAVGEITGTVAIATSVLQLDAEYLSDNMSGDELAPGPYVLLEVHDTGQGMDQTTLARIFDPFFTTKFTGRGLGLAAVLGIVRGHKGAIKVYSNPGQGTTFKLFFPAVTTEISRAGLTPDRADYSGDATVLVVDDEEVVLRMAQSTLKKYGYTVLAAANGREAVDIFKAQPDRVRLVLLDMTMPVMSGEDTLRELKAIRSGVRVIISSGYNEIEALRRFGESVSGFLQKPYRAAMLAEKVKQSL